jgi:predicted nucleotidyltransferase
MQKFPRHLQSALDYLQKQVGKNDVIVLFGSRVSEDAKKNADFDIGLFMQTPLAWKTFAVWKTHAEELAWPYRIDLVDLSRAPSDFLNVVKQQMIVLHGEWHDAKGITRES